VEEVRLAAKDINKIFISNKKEVVALQDVSLDIKTGEFVSLLGPSAAENPLFSDWWPAWTLILRAIFNWMASK